MNKSKISIVKSWEYYLLVIIGIAGSILASVWIIKASEWKLNWSNISIATGFILLLLWVFGYWNLSPNKKGINKETDCSGCNCQ